MSQKPSNPNTPQSVSQLLTLNRDDESDGAIGECALGERWRSDGAGEGGKDSAAIE